MVIFFWNLYSSYKEKLDIGSIMFLVGPTHQASVFLIDDINKIILSLIADFDSRVSPILNVPYY